MNSKFEIELDSKSNERMIDVKKSAMENKKKYLYNQEVVSKDVFLNQYNESGKILDEDYKNYSIDTESLRVIMGIDIEKIKKVRIENTKIIYKKLECNKHIEFLINNFNEQDGLLFVPIIIEKETRNLLRKYLIENKVYLPVHWPLEEKNNNIFEQELSLICDQRYTETQIEWYIDLIQNFVN